MELVMGDEATESTTGKSSLLEQEGDAAADYLEGLLDILDLDGDIDIDVEGNRAMVSVVEARSGDLQHLVGERGEVLDALQELTRLAAARDTGERSRLMLDIAGARAARRVALVELATAAMAEAKRTAGPVALEPMNPFERKVVHDAVAEAGMVSESEGEEPRRRVVIRTH
jgi:spoIIIJ-associated protein